MTPRKPAQTGRKTAGKGPKSAGGRPRRTTPAQPVAPVARPRPKRTRINLRDRESADRYVERSLANVAGDYDWLRESMKDSIATLEAEVARQTKAVGVVDVVTLERLEAMQGRFARLLGQQTALVDTLLKRFQLLSDLGKPVGDDTRFAPVTFVVDAGRPDSGAD